MDIFGSGAVVHYSATLSGRITRSILIHTESTSIYVAIYLWSNNIHLLDSNANSPALSYNIA